MPDAEGRFKGISVPTVPWHEQTDDERERTVAAGTTGIEPLDSEVEPELRGGGAVWAQVLD